MEDKREKVGESRKERRKKEERKKTEESRKERRKKEEDRRKTKEEIGIAFWAEIGPKLVETKQELTPCEQGGRRESSFLPRFCWISFVGRMRVKLTAQHPVGIPWEKSPAEGAPCHQLGMSIR